MPLTGQLEGIITENSGRVTILKGEMCLWGKGGKFGKRGEKKLRKKSTIFYIDKNENRSYYESIN